MLYLVMIKKQLPKTHNLIKNCSIWFAGLLTGPDEPWTRS